VCPGRVWFSNKATGGLRVESVFRTDSGYPKDMRVSVCMGELYFTTQRVN